MAAAAAKHRVVRRVLIAVIVIALLVLAGAVAVLLPILTHQSAGGSGQTVPEGFVSETTAVGADGRERSLRVQTVDGVAADLSELRPGDELVVTGSGFDSSIGIYVSVCRVPEVPGERPSPCLGGIPEGATEGEASGAEDPQPSIWITDDWAWRSFASQQYDDAERGSFTVRLLVPDATQEGLDCTRVQCAVTTRADHTAARDRVQDMQLPVRFVR